MTLSFNQIWWENWKSEFQQRSVLTELNLKLYSESLITKFLTSLLFPFLLTWSFTMSIGGRIINLYISRPHSQYMNLFVSKQNRLIRICTHKICRWITYIYFINPPIVQKSFCDMDNKHVYILNNYMSDIILTRIVFL